LGYKVEDVLNLGALKKRKKERKKRKEKAEFHWPR
jgi:hypothetical protein